MTYSLDFRKQVLKSLDEGMTYAQAVEFYKLSQTTVQNWKKRVHSKATRQTKPHKIMDDILLNDVKEYPDDYHYERARRLNCSPTGIHNALKRLEISKKKTLEHPKACPVKRAEYLSKLNNYIAQGFPIVYMDESGFELGTIRPYSYAPIGTTCIESYNWQGKKRTNVIGALYKKALFALDYFEKNLKRSIL